MNPVTYPFGFASWLLWRGDVLLQTGGRDVATGPLEECRKVRHVGVATVVLPPGQLTADEGVDRRAFVSQVVARRSQVLLAKDSVRWTSEYGRHETPWRIDPVGIPRRDAIADETGARGTKGD